MEGRLFPGEVCRIIELVRLLVVVVMGKVEVENELL